MSSSVSVRCEIHPYEILPENGDCFLCRSQDYWEIANNAEERAVSTYFSNLRQWKLMEEITDFRKGVVRDVENKRVAEPIVRYHERFAKGDTVGRWTIRYGASKKGGKWGFVCRCVCGTTRWVRAQWLSDGSSTGCPSKKCQLENGEDQ